MNLSFAELVWPEGINTEIFIRDYWQQKPLLIRQALPDFENPISPDELCGLSMDEDMPARLITRSPEVEEGKWHARSGPFTEAELTSLPDKDWSILITDIEKHLPEFQDFLQPFRFIPDWRIDDLMISYAPEGASVGAHTDNYDVFLFQASGKRQWSIIEDGEVDRTCIPDQNIRILANFQPDRTWVLEPGDLLYLPPGVPHHGVAVDMECMTWSVGFRAATQLELVSDLTQVLEQNIKDEVRYADPSYTPQAHAGEISKDALKRFRKIWDELTNPDAEKFATMVGEILTQGRSLPTEDNEQEAEDSFASFAPEDLWERNSHARLAFIQASSDTERATLFVDGQQFPCSLKLARYLTDFREFEHAALADFGTDPLERDVLQKLISLEVLLPAES